MSRLTESAIQQLALLAYQSAIEEEGFQSFLTQLVRCCRAGTAVIATPLVEDRSRFEWFSHQLPPVSQTLYLHHWMAQDPIRSAWQASSLSLAPGTAHCAQEFLPVSQLRKTAYYQEFAKHYGLLDLATLVIGGSLEGAEAFTILTLYRDHDRRPFSDEDCEVLRALNPHLRLALRSHRAVRGMRSQQTAQLAGVDALPQPLWVLSAGMHVQHANPAAHGMLERGEVCCGPWSRLSRLASLDAAALQMLLSRAEGIGGGSLGFWLKRRDKLCFGHAQAFRIPAELQKLWPQGKALLVADMPDAELLQRTRLQEMAQRCHFTHQETQVLHLLTEGIRSVEVAGRLGIKMSTLRTHIRHLVEKSGERRLMDLMRMLGTGEVRH